MATYYTSDIHFGDERIMRLCHRPFQTVEEMDECIIERWNERVGPDDVVWVLGDIVSPEHFDAALLNRLNGRVRVLAGNHDYPCHGKIMDKTRLRVWFESLFYWEEGLTVLSHCPIMDWVGRESGTVHLYGHVHNKHIPGMAEYYADKLAFNVSMDTNDFRPKTLKELVCEAGKLPLFRAVHGERVRGFDF